MSALLVIAGAANPTAELLIEAARTLGIDSSLADLRHQQFSIVVGTGGVVSLNGEEMEPPKVVVNTSSVNGLGLAGADGLLRQQSSRWRHRHFAAREEQGLLLAALGLFRHGGSLLVNGPEACDLALMPNVVIDRLHRAGLAVDRRADGDRATEILVAGGRGIIHTGPAPNHATIDMAIEVASAAEFQLGAVKIFTEASGQRVICGWTERPDLSRWPRSSDCALEILRSFPALRTGARPTSPYPFFIEDIGTDFSQSREGQ